MPPLFIEAFPCVDEREVIKSGLERLRFLALLEDLLSASVNRSTWVALAD